jgi:hypothetical protein
VTDCSVLCLANRHFWRDAHDAKTLTGVILLWIVARWRRYFWDVVGWGEDSTCILTGRYSACRHPIFDGKYNYLRSIFISWYSDVGRDLIPFRNKCLYSSPRPGRLWDQPSLAPNSYRGLFLQGVKRPEHETEYLSSSNPEVENVLYPAWSRWGGVSWMLFQEGRSSNFRLRRGVGQAARTLTVGQAARTLIVGQAVHARNNSPRQVYWSLLCINSE